MSHDKMAAISHGVESARWEPVRRRERGGDRAQERWHMARRSHGWRLWAAVGLAAGFVMPAGGAAPARVSFNRDVRPIMADTCFHCHGFDAKHREAGLRLDNREAALAETEGGAVPIVPGDLDSSVIIRRIFDADDPMPPESAHKPLTDAQKEILRRWVAEGAEYEPHWAYAPLVLWGGEFGRTPMGQGTGRDHHILAFSVFLAGGGIKPGATWGATDELGYRAVENVVAVHDLRATMFALFGIDHQGRAASRGASRPYHGGLDRAALRPRSSLP
jgi:hypothetical protein